MQPFVDEGDDFFATLCNFVLTALLFLCVVLKLAVLGEELEPFLTEDMKSAYVFDSGLVGVGFAAGILGAVVVAIIFAVHQLAVAAQKQVIRIKATGRMPELTLGDAQKWHLFLSHIWGTGQDSRLKPKFPD